MNPTFDVLFVIDRTGKLELVLTDTTNTPDTTGRFKIVYPDGVVIENAQDFAFPQVEKRYDLRVRNGNLINGNYEITQYLSDGIDEFESEKVFNFSFDDPSLILSDTSATSQPSVSFKDNTNYTITNYNDAITRVIKSKFPTQTGIVTELTTPSVELFMSDGGNYYEGIYYPNLSVEVTYTGDEHDVRWIEEKDFEFEVKGFIGLSQLLANLDTIKERLDSNNGNSAQLRNDYLMATSIYTHILARLGGDVNYDAKLLLDRAKKYVDDNPAVTYSSISAMKADDINILDNSLITITGPQKGIFYYNSADTVSLEDGGLVFVTASGKRIKRIWNEDGVIEANWFSVVPDDESYNNHTPIQQMLDLATAGVVKHIKGFSGRYLIANRLDLNNIDGLTIEGTDGAEIYSNTVHHIFKPNGGTGAYCKNLIFKKIKLGNYSADVISSNSLFYVLTTEIKNITFDECIFTAPTSKCNAIKIINENATTGFITDTVNFYKCKFEQIGRMGIEIQNHTYDGVIRYKNITLKDCEFNTFGTVQFGMATSFTGKGTGLYIENCEFKEYTIAGIEIIGCSENTILYNKFWGKSGTSGSGIKMTNNNNIMYNTKLVGNKNITEDYGIYAFHSVENITFTDNDFKTVDKIVLRDAKNVSIYGGSFVTKASYALLIENASNKIRLFNTVLDNTQSTSNFSAFRVSHTTTDVGIYDSQIRKGPGGVIFDSIDTADPIILVNTDYYNDSNVFGYTIDNRYLNYNSTNQTLNFDQRKNIKDKIQIYDEAEYRESNTVIFDKTGGYIIGNAAARTGNVLFDFTNAKLGSTTMMIHQDAADFSLPAQSVVLSGTASATVANYIYFTLVNKTAAAEKVHVTISQEVV